jgi:MFS transporter, ACS family, tartrate transporter
MALVAPAHDDASLASAVGAARRRLIPFLFLLYVFSYLDRVNVGFASLQMNAAIGLSSSAYGVGFGMFFLSYLLFEVPSNMILARVGARLWIARIMVTWGMVSIGMMFVRGAASFYVLRFLLGAAEAGFFPGIIFYLTEWFPARERARTIAAFMTATLIAGVVGGPISGALLTLQGAGGLAGWQWLFLLEGVPSVVLGIVVLRVLVNTPQEAPWLTAPEKDALTRTLRDERVEGTRHGRSASAALSSPVVWLLAAAYFFLIPVALYAFSSWLPQIIQGLYRGGDFGVGVLSAIPYIAGAVAMVIVGRRSDLTRERRWHVAVAAAMSAVGFAMAAATHGLVSSMAALTLAMMGLASTFGPFWTLATGVVNGPGAAAGIAFINSVGNVGGFVGPSVVGYIKDQTQSFTLGLLFVATIVGMGALLVLAVPDAQRRDDLKTRSNGPGSAK